VYSAYWEEIYGVVALKVLKGSQNISDEFMNELKAYYKCFENRKFGFLRCYGISRDPETGCYILVLDYMPKHDLRHNLHNLAQEVWEEKLIVLIDIVKDLYNIHENGFIHRDLHSGNKYISTNEPSEIRKQFDESDRNMKRIEKSSIHPGAIYRSRYIATQRNMINEIE
ncbi:22488_t:CDS:2, partial [Racocetra persica]